MATDIKSKVLTAIKGQLAHRTAKEGTYLAYLKDHTWGSNATKSNNGKMLYNLVAHNLEPATNATATTPASTYLHGVNPFQLVYPTNMNAYGASRSGRTICITWFTDGSAAWDQVGGSTYGPAPGFMLGGSNPGWKLAARCPASCGSTQNNAFCSLSLTPPLGQSVQRSYK